MGGTGGSELPWLLPGVPPALGGVLGGLAGALRAAVPEMDAATAAALAARQWWACDVWPPGPPTSPGPLELCAFAAAGGRPGLTLGEAASAALLATLAGNPAAADAAGSDPAARGAALFFGLAPPALIAASTDMAPDDAATVQLYVRATAAGWVGPSFEAAFLGPPLGPASGGLLVTRPARAWVEGWVDPLLAAALPGVPTNPAATISAALAFSSLDAPALLLGKPLTSLTFRDHPAISTLTLTTGKPTEDVDAAAKRFVYGDASPGRVVRLNGQGVVASFSSVAGAFSFPGPDPANASAAVGGPIPLAGYAFSGSAFGEKVAGKGATLTLFDGGLGRPLTARPTPGALGAGLPHVAASGGNAPSPITHRQGGKQVTVYGIDAVVYGLDADATGSCPLTGGEAAAAATNSTTARRLDPGHRCAFPDPAPWTWNASLMYGAPTLLGLPRWAGAPAGVAAGGGPVLADPPPAAAGSATPPEAAWWFGVEPFSGLAVAAYKPVQVAHRVGPTDALYPRLWSPPGGDGLSGAGGAGGAPGGWLPTHWAAAVFAADIPPMRSGLRIVWAMRVIMSYSVPGVAAGVGAWCAWCLAGSARARETRAALRAVRASRAPPCAMTKEELAGLREGVVEGGGGGGGGGEGA